MATYEYQKPAELDIETPFGTSRLICWGFTARIMPQDGYVEGRQQPNAKINNVDYYMHVELTKPAACAWALTASPDNPTGYRSISLDRYDYKRFDANGHGSDSARKKVREVLVPFVCEYLNNHPELWHEGQIAYFKNEHRRHSDEIAALSEKLAEVEKMRDAAAAELAKLES